MIANRADDKPNPNSNDDYRKAPCVREQPAQFSTGPNGPIDSTFN